MEFRLKNYTPVSQFKELNDRSESFAIQGSVDKLMQDLKFTNHAQQKFATSNEVNTRFETIVKEFDMKLTVKLDKAKFEEKVLELEKMIEKSGKKAAN